MDRVPRTLTRTMEEISWGEKVLVSPRYSTWTMGDPPWSVTLKGQDSISFLTVASSKRRPMRRLWKLQSDFVLSCSVWRRNSCSLDIEDGVLGVHGSLVLSGLTDQTLLRGEGDEWGSGEATLLVGDCGKALGFCANWSMVAVVNTYWSQHCYRRSWRHKSKWYLLSSKLKISPRLRVRGGFIIPRSIPMAPS